MAAKATYYPTHLERKDEYIYAENNLPQTNNGEDALLYKLFLYTVQNTLDEQIKTYSFSDFLNIFISNFIPEKLPPKYN